MVLSGFFNYIPYNLGFILHKQQNFCSVFSTVKNFLEKEAGLEYSFLLKNIKYFSSPILTSDIPVSFLVYLLTDNKEIAASLILDRKMKQILEFTVYEKESRKNFLTASDKLMSEVICMKDYQIKNDTDIPKKEFVKKDLPGIDEVKWNTMSMGKGLRNHCGPTSASNSLLYYEKINGLHLPDSIHEITEKLYKNMSTGKFGTSFKGYMKGFSSYVKNTFPDINLSVHLSVFYGWNYIKHQINEGIILSSYRWSNTFIKGAHYINYIGWREYSDGRKFIRILNEWDGNTHHYISYDFLSRIHSPAVFSFQMMRKSD